MRVTTLAGAALAALAFAAPAAAQQVEAGVAVHTGPVDGHVLVNPQPERRVVVVDRAAPRVIVVDRWQGRRWNGHQRDRYWWRRAGLRQITVYYVDGRYYDRWDDRRRAARTVVLYERDGRFYDDDDDRYDRYERERDRYERERARDDHDRDRDGDRDRDHDRGRHRGHSKHD